MLAPLAVYIPSVVAVACLVVLVQAYVAVADKQDSGTMLWLQALYDVAPLQHRHSP